MLLLTIQLILLYALAYLMHRDNWSHDDRMADIPETWFWATWFLLCIIITAFWVLVIQNWK